LFLQQLVASFPSFAHCCELERWQLWLLKQPWEELPHTSPLHEGTTTA